MSAFAIAAAAVFRLRQVEQRKAENVDRETGFVAKADALVFRKPKEAK